MTLTHLFKAQAIFAWMWVVMIWVAPEMAVQGAGWMLTSNLQSMGEFLSVTFFALGVVSWMMPTWAGDNLKKAGMVMGVYLGILFVAIQTYHVSTGAANLDLMSMVPAIIFPILFYWKSSASD